MNWKENRSWLYPALFAMGDVIHPILESIQVDASHCRSVRCHIEQPAKESLARALQVDDHYRVELHTNSMPPYLCV